MHFDLLHELDRQAQVAQRRLIDGAQRVVDEHRGEEQSEEEDFAVVRLILVRCA